jgi:hypothetical protein
MLNISPSKTKIRQKGVVFVLSIFFMTFIFLPLTAMVIDLGRLIIALRQAQNLADVSATTGINYLGKQCVFNQFLDCGLVRNWATLTGWQSVKPSVKAIATTLSISGAKKFQGTDYFNTGNATLNDMLNYQHDKIVATGGAGADVDIQVRRFSYCYNGASWVKYSLDNRANAHCLANLVEASVTVNNFPNFFGKISGINFFGSKTRVAESHLRWTPNVCGEPSCTIIESALLLPNPCA